MTRRNEHAVVLGASIAGILAARVLADRCTHVTVVDRDELPTAGGHRRGVPQDRHVHMLQPGGLRAIEQLFPGVAGQLVSAGGVSGDLLRDATACYAGNRLVSTEAGIEFVGVTRPLLEGLLRSRLHADTTVRVRERVDVRGLTFDAGGERVTGVRLLPRRDGAAEEVLHADLVVDATGRGSRLAPWLQAAGFEQPAVEETGLDVSYTSCQFPRRAEDRLAFVLVSGAPPGRRGGVAVATEGDSWVVTLGGVLGEQAPTEPDRFVDWAATLPVPDLHELVRDREPLGTPVLMRYPTGRRLRYDQLDRFPEALAVVGDALCSFNPVYGQGMTVAAVEALALARTLDEGREHVGPRLLAACRDVVADAWGLAAGGDARYVPRSDGTPLAARLLGRYQRRLLRAATHDPVVARAFCRVTGMVARPPSLLRPAVASRVLVGGRRQRVTAPAAPVPATSHVYSP